MANRLLKRLLIVIVAIMALSPLCYSQNDTIRRGRGTVSKKLDTLQTKIDTMQQSINALFEIYQNTNELVDNTHRDPVKDGWNVYGWVAFIIALLSLIVAGITFLAQNKTERHTQNAPISAQIGRFKDLTRHLYRNLVCTSAAIAKYNGLVDEDAKLKKDKESYPSESNFNKLKTMPDDVILNIDVNERTYVKMHELKVLLRNYNIEIDVAANHFSKKNIWSPALKQDCDNLIFKPIHLIRESFVPETLLLSADSGQLSLPDRSIFIIFEEHFKKLINNINALGTKDSQEVLRAFFRYKKKQHELDIVYTKEQYDKIIDSSSSLERAIKALISDAVSLYGSSFVKKDNRDNKKVLTVEKVQFIRYLVEQEDKRKAEIKRSIRHSYLASIWNLFLSYVFFFKHKYFKEKASIHNSYRTMLKEQAQAKDNKANNNKKDIKLFLKQISTVKSTEEFISLLEINYEQSNKENVTYKDLFKSLKPYITYISDNSWNFFDALYVILAIDTAIEINRIGMVNYV